MLLQSLQGGIYSESQDYLLRLCSRSIYKHKTSDIKKAARKPLFQYRKDLTNR